MAGSVGLFRKELCVDARKPWIYAIRALFVAVVVAVIWFSWSHALQSALDSAVGRSIFISLIFTEYVLLLFVAPAMCVGTFVSEKSERSLEILLLTELRPSEIVFKKFFAKVAAISTLFLAVLPVVALTMLYGGVAPGQVFASFLLIIATILSIAAFGVHASLREATIEKALLKVAADIILFFFLLPMVVIFVSFVTPVFTLYFILSRGTTAEMVCGLLSVVYLMLVVSMRLRQSIKLLTLYGVTFSMPEARGEGIADRLSSAGSNFFVRRKTLGPDVGNPIRYLERLRATSGQTFFCSMVVIAVAVFIFTASYLIVGMNESVRTAATLSRLLEKLMHAAAVFVAATSISSLRENRALELIVLTHLSSVKLVFGKLSGMFSLVLPLAVAMIVAQAVGHVEPHWEILPELLAELALVMTISALSRTNTRAIFLVFLYYAATIAFPLDLPWTTPVNATAYLLSASALAIGCAILTERAVTASS